MKNEDRQNIARNTAMLDWLSRGAVWWAKATFWLFFASVLVQILGLVLRLTEFIRG